MSEQEDNDNLSRFFQKATHKSRIRFEESDWQKLEARLDAEQSRMKPDNGFTGRTVIVSVALILLFSMSTYLFISHPDKDESNDSKEGKSDQVDSNDKAAQDFGANTQSQTSKVTPYSNSSQSLSENADSLHDESRKRSVRQKMSDTSLKIKNENSPDSKRPSEFLPKSIDSSKEEDANQGVRSQYNNGVENNLSDQEEAMVKKSMNDRVVDNSIEKNTTDHSVLVDSIPNVMAQMNPSVSDSLVDLTHKDSIPRSDKQTFLSHWSVLLTLSPDFSSNGFRRFTAPGDAWGMMVYYRINDVFSVSAGAIRSNKKYQDDGSNYKPNNKNFWTKNTNGITPSEIQGSCRVLELPIGLQYRIKHGKVSNVYVAAGFSSYVMLKESYRYSFDAPNPGAVEGWNAKKKTHSLFNVANLSVGYEWNISKQVSIGISPYIKVPLTGIGGWADVRLYSLGTSFTIRYNLKKNRDDDPYRNPVTN